jgi:hypothetical protein
LVGVPFKLNFVEFVHIRPGSLQIVAACTKFGVVLLWAEGFDAAELTWVSFPLQQFLHIALRLVNIQRSCSKLLTAQIAD